VVSIAGFREIIERGTKIAKEGSEQEFEMFGVRE
jgi:hypothetical protein